MIAVADYGAGNIFSIINALKYLNQPYKLAKCPNDLSDCNKIILPGVGAFKDAAEKLKLTDLFYALRDQAQIKPVLGICLGMQLLFEKGYEFGESEGLGLIPGSVRRLNIPYKVPHIGWNSLVIDNKYCPLLYGIKEGSYFYFVHSFMANTSRFYVAAHCNYGTAIPSLVWKRNIFGTQFHPEKSGDIGIKMLENFCNL